MTTRSFITGSGDPDKLAVVGKRTGRYGFQPTRFSRRTYAEYTKKSARDVLKEWDGKGITDTIFNGYFRYHQERIENAFEDIDSLLATGRHVS